MKNTKCCKNDDFTYKQNGPHIEVRCSVCNKHIKFISKEEFKELNIELPATRSKGLF